MEWACIIGRTLDILGKSSISEQAKNYLKNNFLLDITEYDVIIGYRADDSYFSFAQDFVANVISLRQLDKSPEYWTGWVLAYYQWYRGMRFSRIQAAVSVTEVYGMYETMHEADIIRFVTAMDEKLKAFYHETNLKRMRENAGYSQRQLAEESGVPIRQIQLFEQRRRDINKTQLETEWKLAKALACRIEDLAEVQ